ncbi:MAG TPA: DUF948 domain-containing protein [Streptosporangiaceae bacterium]|jgi:hypothetical protein
MSAGQLAALIAVGFFGLLACAGVFVLIRLGKFLGVATQMATRYRDRADTLLDQAQAVVDRTNEQLARTDSITASMDEVTANMAELSGNVSVLAGFAQGLASAVSRPVTGLAALSYGVRHAVSLRRPDVVPPLSAASPAVHGPEPAAAQPPRPPAESRAAQLPAGTRAARLPAGTRAARLPAEPRAGRQPAEPRAARLPAEPRAGRLPTGAARRGGLGR